MKKTTVRSSKTGRFVRRGGAKLGHAPERFAWATVDQVPTEAPVPLRGNSKLIPLGADALLHWVFDVDEDGQESILILHLTDREAQKVWETPQRRGMIEAVRANLSDPWGLLIREAGEQQFTRMFKVPTDLHELEFVADLLGAADGAKQWYENYRYMLESELADKKKQLTAAGSEPDVRRLRRQIEAAEREKTLIERSSGLLSTS